MLELTLRDGRKFVGRELKKGDEKSLAKFNDDFSERSRKLFMPHKYDDDTLSKVIERAKKGNDTAFVALDGDRIIAYWFLWWVDTPFPVLGIGILDEFHGQGLGKRLMSHLIETAENSGCDAIELTTALDNKPGQILYEKMGFVRNGTVDNVAGDGRIITEWLMYYPIKHGVVPPPREHRSPV